MSRTALSANLLFSHLGDNLAIEKYRTRFATHEAKELQRIRNSISFKAVNMLYTAIRNPLKIPLLPFYIVRELFFKKSKKVVHQQELDANSLVIVGIDSRGAKWSERSLKLALELQRFDTGLRISVLTTGEEIMNDRVGKLLHFRIPRPRSIDSSRKDWNLTCQRLLSMIIHLQQSTTVVYLGDYLYSGIRHSLNSGPTGIRLHWINSGSNQIGLEQILVKNSTSVFEEFQSPSEEQLELSKVTMQDQLNLRLDRTILVHLQVTSSGLDLWESTLEKGIISSKYSSEVVTSSDKKFGYLSGTIELPRHIDPFSTPGFHFRIIDDHPESIARINNDGIPSLILRTERVLDKVSLKVLEELERHGVAIVLRKIELVTMIDAIETICNVESRNRMNARQRKTSVRATDEISWAASMHSLLLSD